MKSMVCKLELWMQWESCFQIPIWVVLCYSAHNLVFKNGHRIVQLWYQWNKVVVRQSELLLLLESCAVKCFSSKICNAANGLLSLSFRCLCYSRLLQKKIGSLKKDWQFRAIITVCWFLWQQMKMYERICFLHFTVCFWHDIWRWIVSKR